MPNSQPNWKDKIEQIETEINKVAPIYQEKSVGFITTVKNWFITLPTTGKAIVGILGLMVALSLLKTIFSLVQLAFSFVILSVIFYLVYQFVINQKNN